MMGIKEHRTGVEYFEASLRDCGEHHVTFYNLGICHFHIEELQDAARCFSRSLALRPDYADAAAWRDRVQARLATDAAAAAVLDAAAAPPPAGGEPGSDGDGGDGVGGGGGGGGGAERERGRASTGTPAREARGAVAAGAVTSLLAAATAATAASAAAAAAAGTAAAAPGGAPAVELDAVHLQVSGQGGAPGAAMRP